MKIDPLTPDTQVLAEFPSGYTMLVIGSTVNQIGLEEMLRGHRGTLYFGGNRVELKPERPFSDELDPDTFTDLNPSGAAFVAEFHQNIEQNQPGIHSRRFSIRENGMPL